MTLACEGSATPTLATGSGSFDFARRLASLRMTLASDGSATHALEATSCGSFDFDRRVRFAQDDTYSVPAVERLVVPVVVVDDAQVRLRFGERDLLDER